MKGVRSNRDANGARVEIDVAGRTLSQTVMPTRSYLSQVELPLTFGLGDQNQITAARIIWPDGTRTPERLLVQTESLRLK